MSKDYDTLKDVIEDWATANEVRHPDMFAENCVSAIRVGLLNDDDSDENVNDVESATNNS